MAKPKQNKITNTKQSRMHFDSQELANKEEQIRKLTESVLDFVPASNIATQAVYFEELWNKQMNMNDYRMDNSSLSDEKKTELLGYAVPFDTKEDLKEKERLGMDDDEWQLKRKIKNADQKIEILSHILNNMPKHNKSIVLNELITKRLFWQLGNIATDKIQEAIEELNNNAQNNQRKKSK